MAIIYYNEDQGGTDQPVLPYLLFGGSSYYDTSGGVGDLLASADSVEELKQFGSVVAKDTTADDVFVAVNKWYQIVEHKTLQVIEEGHPNEDD